MSDVLRGQNIRVETAIDGEVQQAFLLNTEGSVTPNIASDQRDYQGQKSPVFRSTWNGVELSLTSEPTTSDWSRLLFLSIAKAKQEPDAMETIINVTFSVDYGNGDVKRFMLVDATYHSPGIPLPGRTDVQQLTSSFSASDMIEI